MTHRRGLMAALLSAAAGFFILSFIVSETDPTAGQIWPKVGFFASLFMLINGLLVPVIFYSRFLGGNREVLYANFPVAVRQAFLLALLFTAILLLQTLRSLTWWDAILLAVGVGFAELAMRSRL